MKKDKYIAPNMEIVEFQSDDVIIASPPPWAQAHLSINDFPEYKKGKGNKNNRSMPGSKTY